MTRVSDRQGHRPQYYGHVRPSGSRRLAALVCCAALAFAACGSGERSFSAEDFVEEANAQGANLSLGEPLEAAQPDAEIYALRLGNPAKGSEPPALGEEYGSGSLRVEDSPDAAEAEYARCAQAELFCYRAANIVLVFEQDADAEALAELAQAIRALKSG